MEEVKPKNDKALKGCLGIIVISLVIIIGAFMFGEDESKENSDPNKPKITTVWTNARNYAKATLKYPETYESVKWGNLTPVSDTEYIIYHIYTGKNAFGVPEKFNTLFYVDRQGEITQTKVQDPNTL